MPSPTHTPTYSRITVDNLLANKVDKGTVPNYLGTFDNTKAYTAGSLVVLNGGSWLAGSAIPAGNNPNTSGDGITATNGWTSFAAKGAVGPTGTRGSQIYTGTGAPGTITGVLVNDKYIDGSTGDLYSYS